MDQRSLYFLGDIHGDFKRLATRLSLNDLSNATIIQVGDFGIGFNQDERKDLKILNEVLETSNCNLLVIRGNHDQPSAFENTLIDSNITLLKDYTLKSIHGLNILFTGGAISIDRINRKAGISYWQDEAFVFDKAKLDEAIRHCSRLDIVVTHSAPQIAPPYTKDLFVIGYENKDPYLNSDVKEDRLSHTKLLQYIIQKQLAPTHWYYGHFHTSQKISIQDVEFNLLDVDELRPHRIIDFI